RRLGRLNGHCARGPIEPTPEQPPGADDQQDQDVEPDRPKPGLIVETDKRLHEQGIGQERQKASDVARRVKKIWIARGRVVGASEPRLQQRAVGGKREERKPDRGREYSEQPEGLTERRRFAPAAGDGKRKGETGGDHDRELDKE